MYNYIWLCKSRTRKTIYYLCIRFFYIRILQKFQALFNILALSLVFSFFFFEKKSNPDAVGLIPQRTQKGTSMLFFVLCFIVCLCFWLTNVKGGSIQSTALFFLRNCTTKKKIAKSILQNTVETLFYASILLQYRFVSKLSLKWVDIEAPKRVHGCNFIS